MSHIHLFLFANEFWSDIPSYDDTFTPGYTIYDGFRRFLVWFGCWKWFTWLGIGICISPMVMLYEFHFHLKRNIFHHLILGLDYLLTIPFPALSTSPIVFGILHVWLNRTLLVLAWCVSSFIIIYHFNEKMVNNIT